MSELTLTGAGIIICGVIVLAVGMLLGYFAQGRRGLITRILILLLLIVGVTAIVALVGTVIWVIFGWQIKITFPENVSDTAGGRFNQITEWVDGLFQGTQDIWGGDGKK